LGPGYHLGSSALFVVHLHTKCASCVHFCGQPHGGNGFCRIWSTVLSISLSLPEHCPHWRGVPSSRSRSIG